ncbi:MAG: DUF4293 domain-containing protein [Bacteroidota bacterium]|nr:DUF4293 domain-containing protein [Bacteroidota bacterium]
MWQRIQTLYLLISTVLLGILCFSSVATFVEADGTVTAISYWDKVVYWVLLSVCLLGNLVALNTYKLMVLQMRVTTLTALITFGFAVVLGIDWLRLSSEQLSFSYNIVFPAVCTVLDALALRGILHDQLMVEAAGRLRNHYRSKGRKK